MLANPTIPNHYSQSILIVDDNDMLLELLVNGFEMFGFNVWKADNGLDAWNLFNSEPVDIVLTDIQMPGLDGIELSKRIRNQSPHTKIAVMTGGNTDIAAELLNDGTATFLFKKPFEISCVCKSLLSEAWMA